MNEEKIKRLNDLNNSINSVEREIHARKKLHYIKSVDIGLTWIKIDLRILLACLKIEKENLEEEIKGEIKNEK